MRQCEPREMKQEKKPLKTDLSFGLQVSKATGAVDPLRKSNS